MAEHFRLEGAVGSIAGGVFLVLGHLLNYLGGQPSGTTAGKTLVFAGHLVLVFAFIGVYSHQRHHKRAPIGRVGMILSTIGTVLVCAIVFVEVAGTTNVDITPIFETAGTTVLYSVGPLVFVVGMVLVGASILRRTDQPRGAGGLLIGGTAIFAAASAIAEFAALLTVVGAVVTASGFVWIGVTLYGSSAGRTGIGGV